ncbi:hypothetical protein [Tardiphaga sp. 862_B3_N1_1]|uniref:hypothetical protein n=1 Tax=Tardiphaga sp. 862_B3_N1_1 TaxID=3240763 RepID=UPI003F8A24AD
MELDRSKQDIFTPSVKALLRGAIVSSIYGLLATYYGAPTYKACLLGLVIFIAYILRIGRRHIERLASLWLFATLLYWCEIPPLNRLIDSLYLRVSS